jgi:glycosyltransferase involved in cell wall biosynthesis
VAAESTQGYTEAARRHDWVLPTFDRHIFKPRRTRFCVCVFLINEGQRFKDQLERMSPYLETLDLVIADGGSTDGSAEPELSRNSGARALLVKRSDGGLSAQMRMALAWCLDEQYEGVVLIDGNNKDDPSALPNFETALANGYDHVQGSRYVPGGRGINTPPLRHYAVTLIHAPLISLAAGFRYTDTTNGFRAYSSRLLLDPRVAPFREVFRAYELHYYLAIRAARLGYRCVEIPVTRTYPPDGATPTKIRGIRGNARILRTLIAAARGAWNPGDAASA